MRVRHGVSFVSSKGSIICRLISVNFYKIFAIINRVIKGLHCTINQSVNQNFYWHNEVVLDFCNRGSLLREPATWAGQMGRRIQTVLHGKTRLFLGRWQCDRYIDEFKTPMQPFMPALTHVVIHNLYLFCPMWTGHLRVPTVSCNYLYRCSPYEHQRFLL